MLILIIAESALEKVPQELWCHPAVAKHAKYDNERPGELFLDRSLHHPAMIRLKEAGRRGRPDLVHHTLLAASESPLYMMGELDIYVHTYKEYVIHLGKSVRLPKSYFRFKGLLGKLFSEKMIESKNTLLPTLKRLSFGQLLSQIRPSRVIGLSRLGEPATFQIVGEELARYARPTVVVGGFPRGHFTKKVKQKLDVQYSIHQIPLEAHIVVARIIYEYEKQLERMRNTVGASSL